MNRPAAPAPGTNLPAAPPRRRPSPLRPPLPREHGAWIGVSSACLVGLFAWGLPTLRAAPAALAMVAFFVAKAPVENLATGLSRRRSGIWLGVFLAIGILGVAAAGLPGPLEAVVAAGAVVVLGAQAAARRARRHRALAWETGGFFGFSGAATVVALARDLPVPEALALWPLVGLHLAATVPFVRLSVRPGEIRRPLAAWSLGLALAGPAAALGLSAAGLVPGATAVAFLPGLGKVIAGIRSGKTYRAKRVGLSETAWTSAFVVLLLVSLAVG
jgi:hypothetical protein